MVKTNTTHICQLDIVDNLLPVFLRRLRVMGRADATVEKHHYKCKAILTYFNNRSLFEIGLNDIDAYVENRLSCGVSRHTIHMELRTFRQAWRLERERSPDLPAVFRMPDLGRYYTPGERWLTPEESIKLLTALPAKKQLLVKLALQTGMEKGALQKLEKKHCDFETNLITVPGTKNRYRRNRVVPVPVNTMRELTTIHRVPLFGIWHNASRELKIACVKAGINTCTLTDLRRTFATLHARAGTPMLVLEKLMGHVDGKMLEAVYARVETDQLVATLEAVPEY